MKVGFVSLGCPKQEKWIAMHHGSLQVPVCIGVGGTIDFLATDPELVHDDLLTHAWVDDPVKWLLARITGYRR